MNIARPQAAVPWVPSRSRYAIFRLIAYVRLLKKAGEPCVRDEMRVLALDRDQSTAEHYTIALLVWLTVAAFFAAMLSARVILPVAIIIAIPLAALFLNAAVVATGVAMTALLGALGMPRDASRIVPNSWIFLTGLSLSSSYFAMATTWVRYPAWLFLLTLAVNGAASIALFFLRARVRAAEARCVA
ncbi:MAG: hypothetical protein ACXV5L_05180 [Thermoanaerobaculia bacterium]